MSDENASVSVVKALLGGGTFLLPFAVASQGINPSHFLCLTLILPQEYTQEPWECLCSDCSHSTPHEWSFALRHLSPAPLRAGSPSFSFRFGFLDLSLISSLISLSYEILGSFVGRTVFVAVVLSNLGTCTIYFVTWFVFPSFLRNEFVFRLISSMKLSVSISPTISKISYLALYTLIQLVLSHVPPQYYKHLTSFLGNMSFSSGMLYRLLSSPWFCSRHSLDQGRPGTRRHPFVLFIPLLLIRWLSIILRDSLFCIFCSRCSLFHRKRYAEPLSLRARRIWIISARYRFLYHVFSRDLSLLRLVC